MTSLLKNTRFFHSFSLAATLFCLSGLCAAQTTTPSRFHIPPAGGAERQAMMKALRAHYKKQTGQTVIFQVFYIKVHHGWAWLNIRPLDDNQQPLAEGGSYLMHLEKGNWKAKDLSVALDEHDTMGEFNANPGFVHRLRKAYPGIPKDIFPHPSR
jgi:hypothetical protein